MTTKWKQGALAVVGMVLLTLGCPQPSGESSSSSSGMVTPQDRISLPDPVGVAAGDPNALALPGMEAVAQDRFASSTACALCHSNHSAATAMRDEASREIAPFNLWQSSMMANAARDPLWRAVVSAEVATTPAAAVAIEAKCMRCHAPMASEAARADGFEPAISDLQVATNSFSTLARDGVSCTVCHQIQQDNLGGDDSFNGGFTIGSQRLIYGPHRNPVPGPMQVHVDYTPTYGPHVTESAMCGTCHNLATHALDANGAVVEGAAFQEQATYSEWLNSIYNTDANVDGRSCQSCHMPTTSVDGNPITTRIARSPPGGDFNINARDPFGRHVFAGANVLMPAIINAERDILNPQAPSGAFEATISMARQRLEEETATLAVTNVEHAGGALSFQVTVGSQAGHKFPTGFPSRRAWLRARVLNAAGETLFVSGAFNAQGRLVDGAGNVLDVEKANGPFEPHHDRITASDQVQVYEQVMGNSAGQRTPSILRATAYLKDNRLLPAGYDAQHQSHATTAPVGVVDGNFVGGEDRVTFAVELGSQAPARVEVALFYQTVGGRFVTDLFQVDTPEVRAFRTMYDRADVTPVQVAAVQQDL
jgi:hypothetical protein